MSTTIGVVADTANIEGNFNVYNSLPTEFTELSVPRPSPMFQGREDVKEMLDQLFFIKRKKKVVVSGLAGYGKTELAKQYAQYAKETHKIKWAFWVAAETTGNLEQKYEKLQTSYKTFENDICLYVLDNAETLSSVSKYLPPDTANFLVLVTSQYAKWGDDVETVQLKPVSRNTSFIIFQKILGDVQYKRLDKNQIEKLIKIVNDIPLGLVVIAGHLRDQMEIDNFDMKYFTKMLSSDMLDKGVEASVDSSYNKTIRAAIFGMVDKMTSWQNAGEKENRITNMLLCVCAHLDPDELLIEEVKEILGMCEETDSNLIDRCAHTIKKFSFFESHVRNYFGKPFTYFKIHRMCQDILRKYYGKKIKKEDIKDDCYSKCIEWALQNRNSYTIQYAAIFRHADENKTIVIKIICKYYTSGFTDLFNINFQSTHFQNLKRILQLLARHGCVECLASFLNDIHESSRKKILHETRLLHEAARATQGRPYDTVRFLLERGSDVLAVGGDGKTALHWAAGGGDANVVKLLLERGSDIRAVSGDGRTELHEAAERGHANIVKLLLEGGSDVRAVDGSSWTALHWASERGHADVVKLLLERDSDVRAVDGSGWTALHWAAERGHANVVKLLLEGGSDVRAVTRDGWTALHEAAERGHADIVKLLLKGGSDIRAVSGSGWTALHWATKDGHVDVVKILLEEGSDVHAVDEDGRIALHLAAMFRHANVVKLLLDGGSNVRAVTSYSWTALHFATLNGQADVVKLLLEGGSDVRAVTSYSWIALHFAALNGHMDVVKLLLEEGSDIRAVTEYGWTALHFATLNGQAGIVKLLLEGGSDVRAVTGYCRTALYFAAEHGHADVMKLLLEGGSDVLAVDDGDRTALHFAAEHGHADVVKLLLEGGSNFRAVDGDGRTALHLAAGDGHADVVELLLVRGADVNARDQRGRTALNLASAWGHAEAAGILQEHGAASH